MRYTHSQEDIVDSYEDSREMYKELYWRGIYSTQVEYIQYLNTTAEALTSYAYVSMRASQA